MKPKDLSGRRFGKLIAVEKVGSSKNRHAIWLTVCDCGVESNKLATLLVSGRTKSCGQCVESKFTKGHKRLVTHGMSKTKIYLQFKGMRDRCVNPKNKSYPNYGGRGITVCDEWKDFSVFYDWAINHPTYQKGYSLERTDVNGNYCPENCKWIPKPDQSKNKRNSVKVEWDGELVLLRDLAREVSTLNPNTVCDRYRNGMPLEDALFWDKRTKSMRYKRLEEE